MPRYTRRGKDGEEGLVLCPGCSSSRIHVATIDESRKIDGYPPCISTSPHDIDGNPYMEQTETPGDRALTYWRMLVKITGVSDERGFISKSF